MWKLMSTSLLGNSASAQAPSLSCVHLVHLLFHRARASVRIHPLN